jgi:hypothetical protein
MRLTNTLRQAFVKAVMQDVPKIDDQEQIRSLIQKAVKEALPAKVAAVWNDPQLRAYITTGSLSCKWGTSAENVYMSIELPSTRHYSYEGVDVPVKVVEEANALGVAWYRQIAVRDVLEKKLTQAAASVMTRKALAELLPEFEKYLPADEANAQKTNLPALANVVSDFVKAGWPKQNQGKIAKAKAVAQPA